MLSAVTPAAEITCQPASDVNHVSSVPSRAAPPPTNVSHQRLLPAAPDLAAQSPPAASDLAAQITAAPDPAARNSASAVAPVLTEIQQPSALPPPDTTSALGTHSMMAVVVSELCFGVRLRLMIAAVLIGLLLVASMSVVVSAEPSLKPEAKAQNYEKEEVQINQVMKVASTTKIRSGYVHVWPEMKIGWKIVVGSIVAFFGAACGSVGAF
ncbi:hypothetical protein LWI29_003169 [Acer saccharum]|uniref:Transmembrane protein n=1 Tax=Acer saccharum TaxID=4024 RepID=A0AA39SNB5_ACESA|nr:hypothetical protein LWI29_003169 [Acer saccharum]